MLETTGGGREDFISLQISVDYCSKQDLCLIYSQRCFPKKGCFVATRFMYRVSHNSNTRFIYNPFTHKENALRKIILGPPLKVYLIYTPFTLDSLV